MSVTKKRSRGDDPTLSAVTKLAFIESRIKRICAALGCGEVTAKLLLRKGRLPAHYEDKAFDELKQRLAFNKRLMDHALALVEAMEQERRHGGIEGARNLGARPVRA